MNVEINPRKVFITLLIIISFLLLANVMLIIGEQLFHLKECKIFNAFSQMFGFDFEKNIPTLYSSFALFVSSLLLLIIGIKQKSMGFNYLAWFGLMLIFLFLSLDEVAEIHERLGSPTHIALNTSGLLYFAWVIPYGVMLFAFVALYLRFLLKLPKRIMNLFIISGTIFVTGAIGFEMLGAVPYVQYGDKSLLYAVFYTFEEFFEMLGIILFIYTLLSYINDQFDYLAITMKEKI